MNEILTKQKLTPDTTLMVISAPQIAAKAGAGQFVVLMLDKEAERIPLTLSDWDKDKGTITLIFKEIGCSTKRLGKLSPGKTIAHLLGPLGHPTEIKNLGTVVTIAGGVGAAEIYPVSRAFKEEGNRLICIIGARSEEEIILKDKLKTVCDELFISTDNGSLGKKGFVTDILSEFLSTVEKSTHTVFPELIYAIGPVAMMKKVSEVSRPYGIKTIVSVNPIMVDATGMCGSCRCTVAGKTVFGCVDGPDFDGHALDFEELERRLVAFKAEEASIDKRKHKVNK